jgi:hypothetical protein
MDTGGDVRSRFHSWFVEPSDCGKRGREARHHPAGECGGKSTGSEVGALDRAKCIALAKENAGLAENAVARNQWLAWYVANKAEANEEVTLALFEALYAEAKFKNLANPKVPSSLSISNDGTGQDHDSVGVLQQRVKKDGSSRGWGNVHQAMDPEHAMGEFLERAKGSRKAGQGAHKVAQSIQRSAFSDGRNYAAKEAVAHDLIFRMGKSCVA